MEAVTNLFDKVSETVDGPERRYLESYRSLLFGQYRAMPREKAPKEAREEADAILEKKAKVEWEDLYRLESLLVQIEPPESLRRRAWTIRSEYKSIASPSDFKDYLDSSPPSADHESDLPALREDILRLQHELNWHYLVTWAFEAFRSHITRWVCRTGLVTLGVIAFVLPRFGGIFSQSLDLNLNMLLMIVGFGVAGGLTSTLRRIQQATYEGHDLDLARLDQSNASIYVSPVLGGVFAMILYLLFSGGILSGSVFPQGDPRLGGRCVCRSGGRRRVGKAAGLVVRRRLRGKIRAGPPATPSRRVSQAADRVRHGETGQAWQVDLHFVERSHSESARAPEPP